MAYKVLIGCNGWSLTKECWNPFFVGSDSSPAISDAHDEVIVGSYDNFIYNLNLQTGELNWKAKGSGGEDSPKLSPSDGSFIYAWGNLQGATLDKINRSDGRLIWSAKSPSGNADITTAGAVDDSLSLVFAGTSSGKFYAVNTFDGSIAWTYDMGCKGEMWGTLGPLSISDSTVCVGAGGNAIPYLNMDAKLVCLDKASGNLVWEAPAGKQIQSRPSLGSELIFVGDYSGHLFGYETSTGKLAFDSKLGGGILEGSPIVLNQQSGNEIVLVDSWDGLIYAVNAQDGSLNWKTQVAQSKNDGGGLGSSPVWVRKFSSLPNWKENCVFRPAEWNQ